MKKNPGKLIAAVICASMAFSAVQSASYAAISVTAQTSRSVKADSGDRL